MAGCVVDYEQLTFRVISWPTKDSPLLMMAALLGMVCGSPPIHPSSRYQALRSDLTSDVVNVFYVSIRATENYEFDKIRTAGLTENAPHNKNSQGDNSICSTRHGRRQRGASGARPPHMKSVPPLFHVWLAAYIQYCIFKMWPPLLVF